MKRLQMTGQVFGRLTVISEGKPKGVNKKTAWICQCECGKKINVTTENLRSGNSKSCGCLRKEWGARLNRTHGQSVGRKSTREIVAYHHLKSRCYNPKDSRYPVYGGRGIAMCDRWRESAAAFIEDMGPCPKRYALTRIDINKNFEPGNCIWAKVTHETRNGAHNLKVSWEGRDWTLAELAEHLDVPYKRLHAHYQGKNPKTIEQAVEHVRRVQQKEREAYE